MTFKDVTDQFLLHLDADDDRSPGLHVSQVIRSAAIKLKKLKVNEDEEELGEADRFKAGAAHTLRIMLGLAWELFLATCHKWIFFHSGEVKLDGIIGTPDGDSIVHRLWNLHEFKLTWKSSNKPVCEQWYWLSQIMAYLMMYKAKSLTAYLHVYWVNGNYRGSGPQYEVWFIQFTETEVQANWRMILQEAWDKWGHDPRQHTGAKSGMLPEFTGR